MKKLLTKKEIVRIEQDLYDQGLSREFVTGYIEAWVLANKLNYSFNLLSLANERFRILNIIRDCEISPGTYEIGVEDFEEIEKGN